VMMATAPSTLSAIPEASTSPAPTAGQDPCRPASTGTPRLHSSPAVVTSDARTRSRASTRAIR